MTDHTADCATPIRLSAWTLHYDTLNNKAVAYSNDTDFLVQVGKGAKGSYKTQYTVKGNLAQAVRLYDGINIGHGYKKRLLMP